MGKEIKGNFVYPNGFDEKHVSGAFGGFTPKGDFVINFFNEYPILPDSYRIQLDDQDKVTSDSLSYGDNSILYNRKVVSSVVMNKDTLNDLIFWLNSYKANDENEV